MFRLSLDSDGQSQTAEADVGRARHIIRRIRVFKAGRVVVPVLPLQAAAQEHDCATGQRSATFDADGQFRNAHDGICQIQVVIDLTRQVQYIAYNAFMFADYYLRLRIAYFT